MTSRIIQKEFLFQPELPLLPRVSLAGPWSVFMNQYAVWPYNDNNVGFSVKILAEKGYYSVVGAVDNSGTLIVNGTRCTVYNFDYPVNNLEPRQTTIIYHEGGFLNVGITAVNFGGPRGVAATIRWYDPTKPIGQQIGYELWNTRSSSDALGRYLIYSMPFRANITAYVWGGGGGGGGMDAFSQGGLGSPGLYNTHTFTVERGDLVEIFVGAGGLGGASDSYGGGGGASGRSRLNINADATKSLNGGKGGSEGARSGGGGGGGGASGVLVNNVPVIVAAGGGGGGGAGVRDGNTASSYARRDASITNNAIGASGTDYRGENGQNKSGDGGGGGGGGGGYPGGQGGATFGGDESAFAGQCGGNFPIFGATTGINSPYYKSGYANGGARGSGNGQDGRVFLLIQPLSLLTTKVAGAWKQVPSASVKVDGSWKNINRIFVKVGNSWKQVGDSGENDVRIYLSNGSDYGSSTRPYS